MENDKKEKRSQRDQPEMSRLGHDSSSNILPSDQRKREELTKAFEKNLEGLENLVKLFKSDVSKMFDISDPNSSDSEIEIEEATKLKEYLSQPGKPIIDTGSDLTILSEDYAKRLGLKIVPISPER